MEKLKNFFSNYKSDILNVLGVIALVAVVVVGAVLFFGRDSAEPDVVEDSTVAATTEVTTTEPTTVEAETTTEAAVTTTKAPVTTTKAPVTTTKAPVTTTKAPANNTPVNTEQGTLPDALTQGHTPGDGAYEMNLDTYNMDANTMAAYNDALSRGVKPTRVYYKNGKYSDVIHTGWDEPYDTVFLCSRCGKPQGGGTHGTCGSSFNGCNCHMCGEWIPAGGCHTCKY